MSHGVKHTVFVLADNIIGFAEGYLLHELGLQWLVPIMLGKAWAAVPIHSTPTAKLIP